MVINYYSHWYLYHLLLRSATPHQLSCADHVTCTCVVLLGHVLPYVISSLLHPVLLVLHYLPGTVTHVSGVVAVRAVHRDGRMVDQRRHPSHHVVYS